MPWLTPALRDFDARVTARSGRREHRVLAADRRARPARSADGGDAAGRRGLDVLAAAAARPVLLLYIVLVVLLSTRTDPLARPTEAVAVVLGVPVAVIVVLTVALPVLLHSDGECRPSTIALP